MHALRRSAPEGAYTLVGITLDQARRHPRMGPGPRAGLQATAIAGVAVDEEA
jgi:hypothetical protein